MSCRWNGDRESQFRNPERVATAEFVSQNSEPLSVKQPAPGRKGHELIFPVDIAYALSSLSGSSSLTAAE